MQEIWLLMIGMLVGSPAVAGELKAGKAKTVWACEDLELQEQSWKLDKTKGIAWRLKLPRDKTRFTVKTGEGWDNRRPPGDGWVGIGQRGEGLVVSAGKTLQNLAEKGARAVLQQGFFGPVVVYREQWEPGPRDAVQTAPWLLNEGQINITRLPIDSSAARVAAVVGISNVWLVAVADKRDIEKTDSGLELQNPSLRGMPMETFARYLRDFTDAVQAVELGAGATLRVEAQGCGNTFSVKGQQEPPVTTVFRVP